MEKSTSWKVWTVGICIIVSSITSCTTQLLTGGDLAGALGSGASGVKEGVEIIQSGELPAGEAASEAK